MIAHGGGIPPSRPANSPYVSRGALSVDVAALVEYTARVRAGVEVNRQRPQREAFKESLYVGVGARDE